MKKSLKIFIALVSGIVVLAAVLAGLWFGALNPYRGTVKHSVQTEALDKILTQKQAQQDLTFVIKKLQSRHPAWLEKQNKRVQKVEAQYKTEMSLINGPVTTLYVWQAVGRILHPLYDGHSYVFSSYPTQLYINDFAEVNKYGVPVSINGIKTQDVQEAFYSVFQYEMEEYAQNVFSRIIINKNNLAWCGVDVSDGVRFVFDTEQGLKEFYYDFVPIEQVKNYEVAESSDWVRYQIIEQKNAAVFTLDSCVFNEEYKNTVQEFFDAVSKNNIQNVIVDLRSNGGGNSYVANWFLRYVNVDGYCHWASEVRFGNFLWKNKRQYEKNKTLSPVFDGNLYVLTSLNTFSAAMDFAMLVGDNSIGLLVGEKCGNLPSSYGDVLSFSLPNSKLVLGVSYKKWYRVDEKKGGLPLEPDIPCKSDDALNVVLDML